MRKGMAGTKRGYDSCASCGHARVRHMRRGLGKCVMVSVLHRQDLDGQPFQSSRCTCENFTEPTRKA